VSGRHALWYLVVLAMLVNFGVYALSVHNVTEIRNLQAAQQRAGQMVETKLCHDVGTMAALQPPGGSAASNPSRAYEQAEHVAWTGLVRDLGCNRKATP
jgi:hypothetical protein